MSDSIIELKNISVHFQNGSESIDAVKNINLAIEKGEIFGIVGYSGAGKSSLVRLINLLHHPSSGDMMIGQTKTVKNGNVLIKGKELRNLRQKIGMIFQHFNLLDQSTVLGNVLFALKHSKMSKEKRLEKAKKLVEEVGLFDRIDNHPSQLSGGQKQRVAIARALANDPEILISDEATSALDPKTTKQILELLADLNKRTGLTIVLITHEMQVVKNIANRVAVMRDGEIIEKNSTYSIFADPQKPLTKEFIESASGNQEALEKILRQPEIVRLQKNEFLIQLGFSGSSTDEPLISSLAKNYGVSANILYGNVETIENIPIGTLIVVLSGTATKLKQALDEIKKQNVKLEIIKEGK
ncbi:methionine ABC transporter ATP-binding protein [Oenococcus oeni]|uniref:methionine ABC transporter ATP-binding protein n=2 Tax=Oenococcus oeni TaxID=1247 RepID=UPI000277B3A5|nr:methionine ABC transporter ATP-binding protein [Oenococcus oeni]EJO05124.1 ABC-type metal ion transport system, ATPase component [Oenococcus oeni AWRIB548]EJO07948.1 ABC-type metal ion transport system, ATPase component [Oenococcus oeni AWRIB422]KEP86177.1 methionine ABC transporter ATP-binding protein [Oenococcus oeni IOEB_0205]KGH67369.1 methionine ABC transporter ATP-binding protein [Oenococcus oeni IOEB_B16]OIL79422.1 methionine ABC transporter ATP-binding protein [Oenococcus oeni]